MFQKFFVLAFFATILAVLTSSPAHAYGAAHSGYTAVSPTGGVQHYGSTTASGAYGSYSHTGSTTAAGGTTYHTGSTTATGAYGGNASHTSSTTTSRVYSPTAYQGYSAAGHSGTVSTTGVVRYP